MVTDMIPAGGTSEKELLSVAYALEKKSEHPLARAITQRAQQEGFAAAEAEQFKALPGNGLTASLDGAVLLGGSYKFISEQIPVPDEIKANIKRQLKFFIS